MSVLSLGKGLTIKTALTIMDEVPEPLLVCYEDIMKELEHKMIKALVNGIETLHNRPKNQTNKEKELMQEAVEYFVFKLGPVEGFFEESAIPQRSGLQQALTLRSHIKDLPVGVVEILLKNRYLRLKSENDAFYLLLAYIETYHMRYHVGSQMVFLHLASHLRFHHMSLNYLANVVIHCPYITAMEKLTEIMTVALGHRDINQSMLAKRGLAGDLRGAQKSGSMDFRFYFQPHESVEAWKK